MGDRALIQFKGSTGQLSPVCYLHSHGYEVKNFIIELAELMQSRNDDVDYSYARFMGICHSHIEGNISFGGWNFKGELAESDTHGDAGVLVVHCFGNWEVHCSGGYQESFKVYARVCDVTGKGFNEGYCWHDGGFYTKDEKTTAKELRKSGADFSNWLGGRDLDSMSDNELIEAAADNDFLYWSDWSECPEDFLLD